MGGAARGDAKGGFGRFEGVLEVVEAASAEKRIEEGGEGDVGAGLGHRGGEGADGVVWAWEEGEGASEEAGGRRGGSDEEVEEGGGKVGAAEAVEAGGGEGEEGARGVEAVELRVGERGGDEGVDAGGVRLRADGELEVEDGGAGGGRCRGVGRDRRVGRGGWDGRRRGIDVGECGEAADEMCGDGGRVGVAAAQEGRHGERARGFARVWAFGGLSPSCAVQARRLEC